MNLRSSQTRPLPLRFVGQPSQTLINPAQRGGGSLFDTALQTLMQFVHAKPGPLFNSKPDVNKIFSHIAAILPVIKQISLFQPPTLVDSNHRRQLTAFSFLQARIGHMDGLARCRGTLVICSASKHRNSQGPGVDQMRTVEAARGPDGEKGFSDSGVPGARTMVSEGMRQVTLA